jgi:hypothetical protein
LIACSKRCAICSENTRSTISSYPLALPRIHILGTWVHKPVLAGLMERIIAHSLNVWISAVPRTGEEIRDILERGGAWEEHPGSREGPWGIPMLGSREGNLYLLEDDRHPDAQRYRTCPRIAPCL